MLASRTRAGTVGPVAPGSSDPNQRTPTVARSTGDFVTAHRVDAASTRCRRTPAVNGSGRRRKSLLHSRDSEGRIVDLPVTGTALAASNVDDPDDRIYDYCVGGVIANGGQRWSAGRAITYQLTPVAGLSDRATPSRTRRSRRHKRGRYGWTDRPPVRPFPTHPCIRDPPAMNTAERTRRLRNAG